MTDYDIVVLGGGPGGYAAALYAASAGQKVALVEKQTVGGTCLHRGCIPAKALLQAAEVFRTVHHASDFGIGLGKNAEPTADWRAVNKRKSGIVSNLHKGLSGLLKWRPRPNPRRSQRMTRCQAAIRNCSCGSTR